MKVYSKTTNWINVNRSELFHRNEHLRLLVWDTLVDKFVPQFIPPKKLLLWMDKFLPSSCLFERTIRYKNVLILYIPTLCKFNPFYKALIIYRWEQMIQLESIF